MAGYSGTPLPQKLGIRDGSRVALVGAPAGFAATLQAPAGADVRLGVRGTHPFDVIVFFTTRAADLQERFAPLAARLVPNGGLWIAWPKKASGVATDVGESIVRDIGLRAGLVDNKICAIDDIWSGLRFVIRVQDRPK